MKAVREAALKPDKELRPIAYRRTTWNGPAQSAESSEGKFVGKKGSIAFSHRGLVFQ